MPDPPPRPERSVAFDDAALEGLELVAIEMTKASVEAFELLPAFAYLPADGAIAFLENLHDETLALALDRTVALLRPRGPSAPLASSLVTLARCLPRQGHHERIAQLLLEALTILRKIGDTAGEGRAMVQLGTALRDAGLAYDALHAYAQATVLLERQSDAAGLAAVAYHHGSLRRQLGLLEEALRSLRDAQRLLPPREGGGVWAQQIRSELANALAQIGDDAGVEHEVEAWLGEDGRDEWEREPQRFALPILHRARLAQRRRDDERALADFALAADLAYRGVMENTTLAFRGPERERTQPAFDEALAFAVGSDHAELAVGVLERSRTVGGQATAGKLDLAGERAAARIAELRAQAERVASAATNAVLLRDPYDMQRCDVEATWLVAEKEALAARARERLAEVTPVDLIAGETQRRLARDSLVIEFAIVRGIVVGFVITADEVAWFPASVLAAQAALLLTAFQHECEAQLPPLALAHLGSGLLGGAADKLIGATRLAVTLPPELAGLPVPALATAPGAPPLVETHEVRLVPSLSLLPDEESGPASPLEPDSPCSIFYVSSPHYEVLDELPGGVVEVAEVRERFPGARVYEGDAARASELFAVGTGPGVLHVICHAVFEPRAPLLSRLLLADRPVFAFEVMLAAFDGAIVNLSGCRTATARVNVGGEAEGLASAFIAAGARAVLGASWPIADASVAAFNAAFYDAALAPGGTIGASVQRAHRAVRAVARTSHPYHWAPFVALEGAAAGGA